LNMQVSFEEHEIHVQFHTYSEQVTS
jgi:hypothetical protein